VKEITLVIGGCRSGKSRQALLLADRLKLGRRIFVATCVPRDSEMQARVDRHQRERGDRWTTVECPLALAAEIERQSAPGTVLLVDCLTLWVSNMLLEGLALEEVLERGAGLGKALGAARGSVILVSNEVGTGIVPENRLARMFRDAAGWVNQAAAASADRVVWMVAGVPVAIKSPGQED
jgi:adenosylcobinamide kinase/adenosylcobinamide-phosphate guanylyltransferase